MTEEIKKAMEALQKEYNQLCGLNGHLRAQIMSLTEGITDNEAQIKTVLKKVRNLEANMPKEEIKEEVKEVSNG